MEMKPITEFNVNALLKNHLTHGEKTDEPVTINLTFADYSCVLSDVSNILTAIETIAINGDKNDLFACGTLAQLCNKMLPYNEFEFLDDLLIKKETTYKKQLFKKIENEKNI